MEKVYTVQEAAKYLKVHRTTIYNWMNEGKMEWYYAGRGRRIKESEVQKQLVLGSAARSEENTEKNLTPVIAV